MPWYANPALWVAIAGVITALGTAIGLIRHAGTSGSQAHPPD